jgi:hypothetical protein
MNDLGPRIRVFLLAGNHILREALGRILQKRVDLFVAGESTEFSNIAALMARSEADVVLTALHGRIVADWETTPASCGSSLVPVGTVGVGGGGRPPPGLNEPR